MIKSTPNSPTFLYDNMPLHWQMTRWEKYGLASILDIARPNVGIEVGTYKGGSLQIISKFADKVYSIDIDHTVRDNLAPEFGNVEFLSGDSKRILPGLLKDIMYEKEQLSFILIDGDHSAEGVRADINSVLQYVPDRPVYVVLHDSFHPPSRKGILSANWNSCAYVHYVEIDFIPGVYHYEAFDTAMARSMFGGFALAIMLPEKRTEPLVIHQAQKGLFDTVFWSSCHAPHRRIIDIAKRLRQKVLG